MQQDILINWSPQETRVAIVENGALQELHMERPLERGLVGNIYLGKVRNVLPGMENLDSLVNQYAMDILKPTQPQQQPQQQMGPPTVNIPGFSDRGQNPFRQSSAFIAPEVLSGQISAQDYQILSEKYTPQQITAMVKGAAAAKQKKKK